MVPQMNLGHFVAFLMLSIFFRVFFDIMYILYVYVCIRVSNLRRHYLPHCLSLSIPPVQSTIHRLFPLLPPSSSTQEISTCFDSPIYDPMRLGFFTFSPFSYRSPFLYFFNLLLPTPFFSIHRHRCLMLHLLSSIGYHPQLHLYPLFFTLTHRSSSFPFPGFQSNDQVDAYQSPLPPVTSII